MVEEHARSSGGLKSNPAPSSFSTLDRVLIGDGSHSAAQTLIYSTMSVSNFCINVRNCLEPLLRHRRAWPSADELVLSFSARVVRLQGRNQRVITSIYRPLRAITNLYKSINHIMHAQWLSIAPCVVSIQCRVCWLPFMSIQCKEA